MVHTPTKTKKKFHPVMKTASLIELLFCLYCNSNKCSCQEGIEQIFYNNIRKSPGLRVFCESPGMTACSQWI